MQFTCPLVAVEDLAVTRRFYEEVLGLRVILDFGANITFEGGFAFQTKETWAQFIERPETEIRSTGNDFELYFEEDHLERFLEKLENVESIVYVHGVKEFPWGQRVVRFYDPDGHIVEVGDSMKSVALRFLAQGLSPEETAARIQHPVEFVRMCMQEKKERV